MVTNGDARDEESKNRDEALMRWEAEYEKMKVGNLGNHGHCREAMNKWGSPSIQHLWLLMAYIASPYEYLL